MKSHDSTTTAGIDVSSDKLDLAFSTGEAVAPVANDKTGHAAIVDILRRRAITRVGIEATGHYGLAVEAALREAGFEVIVVQPVQVGMFRALNRKHAKTDPLDAELIARFVGEQPVRRDFHDPRFAPWREKLLYIEQLKSDVARERIRLRRYADDQLRARTKDRIKRLGQEVREMFAALLAELRADADLASRLDLLVSIPGVGEQSALVLALRMPELGALSREEIAALAGVAPFNADSGKKRGARHIAGGRKPVRDALYTPAVAAATRWNPDLMVFHRRLRAAGKPAKVAFVACLRKLLIIANAVLARGTSWEPKTT